MRTLCRADHQPEHPPDRRAYGSTNSVSDRGANRASNRRTYGSPDRVSDHGADCASNRRAHHFRAYHFRAVPAPDNVRAQYITANRGADPGADQQPDLLSDRAANPASDLGSDHLRAHYVRAHDLRTHNLRANRV